MKRAEKKAYKPRKGSAKPLVNSSVVLKDENPKVLPMLTDQLATSFVLRFRTTASWTGALTVTYANLLDAWLVAATATTAFQLFDYVRIRKVVVRAMGVGTTSTILFTPSATVGVEFPGLVGGQFGSGKQRIGSEIGYDEPAFVSVKPDPMSQSAQYQPSTSNAAFIVRAVDGLRQPIGGAIIDVHVSYKNSGDINPASITTARAGMTAGLLYFGGLDGLAIANTQAATVFIPQI